MIAAAARPGAAAPPSIADGALSGAKVGAVGGAAIGAIGALGSARGLFANGAGRGIATAAAGIGIISLVGAGFGAASGALATRGDSRSSHISLGALGGAAAGLLLLSFPMALAVLHGDTLPPAAWPIGGLSTAAQVVLGGVGGGALIGGVIASRT
jgi:hypothetical protein